MPARNRHGKATCGCCSSTPACRVPRPRFRCLGLTGFRSPTWTWAGKSGWSRSSTTATNIAATEGNTLKTSAGWSGLSSWAGQSSGSLQRTAQPTILRRVRAAHRDVRLCTKGFQCALRAPSVHTRRGERTLDAMDAHSTKPDAPDELEGASGSHPIGHVYQRVAVALGGRDPGQAAQRCLDAQS